MYDILCRIKNYNNGSFCPFSWHVPLLAEPQSAKQKQPSFFPPGLKKYKIAPYFEALVTLKNFTTSFLITQRTKRLHPLRSRWDPDPF